VSGITYTRRRCRWPDAGTILFTVFDEFEFHIYAADLEERRSGRRRRHRLPADACRRRTRPVQPGRHVSRRLPHRAASRAERAGRRVAGVFSSGLSLDYIGQPSIGVGTDSYGQYVGGVTSAYFSDMLGNKALGVQLQAQGTFKDIGGTAFYADFSRRWNWGLGGGRIPYLLPFFNYGSDDRGDYLGFFYYRLFSASSHPFAASATASRSSTRSAASTIPR
jgi:hypothetical protein